MRAKRVVTLPLQPYFGFHWKCEKVPRRFCPLVFLWKTSGPLEIFILCGQGRALYGPMPVKTETFLGVQKLIRSSLNGVSERDIWKINLPFSRLLKILYLRGENCLQNAHSYKQKGPCLKTPQFSTPDFQRTLSAIGPYQFRGKFIWTNHWSIPFPGDIRMDQWSWKFFKSFPLHWYWSMDGSSQRGKFQSRREISNFFLNFCGP